MVDKDELADAETQVQLFAQEDAKPIVLRDEMEALGLLAPHMKPKDLIGETFIIFGAKTFKGKGDPEFDPYFCNCRDLKGEEVWTVVLGGQAVTPIIAGYIALGLNQPIQVTLGWQEGGEYGGYFTLE